MKNPNGYGTIKKLSGNRRRPFVFMVSINGRQKAMGYFSTKLEALAFQVDYNQSHGLHRLSKITFAELYARWMPKHISYASVSKSTVNGYECAYKHCVSLYDLPIADIKYSHLQAVIDDMTNLSYASKKKVRNLLSLLFAHAREMEYTTRDFTGLIKIGKNHPVNPHQAISKRKVNQLWKIVDTPDVDIILILIYTGMGKYKLAGKNYTSFSFPIEANSVLSMQAQLSLGNVVTFAIMITNITNSTFTLYCDTPGEKTVHVIAICV